MTCAFIVTRRTRNMSRNRAGDGLNLSGRVVKPEIPGIDSFLERGEILQGREPCKKELRYR